MKFKACIKDPKTFAAVCNTTKTFQRKCIVKFDPKCIRIIAQTGISDGSQLWTRLHTEATLADVRLESRQGNGIWCEIPDAAQLVSALRCSERCTNVIIRLAKADQRQLLKLSMQSAATNHDITHEVATRVLTEAEVATIVPMALADEHLQVFLPYFADVGLFADRAKNAGCGTISFFATTGSGAGVDGGGAAPTLTISAESTTVAFAAQYTDVSVANADTATLSEAAVTVDLKKFCRFLGVKELCPDQIIFHIVPNQALVISAHGQGDSSLVYYIPALLRT